MKNKTVKKAVALILSAVMVASLTACGSSSSDGNTSETTEASESTESQTDSSNSEDGTDASDNGEESTGTVKELNVGMNQSYTTMTPFSMKMNRMGVDFALFECLARVDGIGGELKGEIAKSWETTDDGTTWQVEIYDYVYDTNGNHITADDVVFSYEQIMANGLLTKCISCVKVDDYTVEITMNGNDEGYLNEVLGGTPIVSKTAYEESADGMASDPVGTSQYAVTDYVAGAYITLERTHNYWQTDESLYGPYADVTVEKITYTSIREASQMTIALETGTIDAMNSIDSTEVTQFYEDAEKAEQFTVRDYENWQATNLFYSGDAGSVVSDDLNLRKAIAYAIDSQGLVDGFLAGLGETIDGFGVPCLPDFPTTGQSYAYDVDKAKECLEESDYNGESIRILAPVERSKLAEIVASYLQAVGINAEVLSYDSALYNTYFRDPSQWDIGVCSAGAEDLNISLWGNYISIKNNDGETTLHGWSDANLETALEAALSTETHSVETMNAVQEILDENLYCRGLFVNTVYDVYNNDSGIVSLRENHPNDWTTAEFAE